MAVFQAAQVGSGEGFRSLRAGSRLRPLRLRQRDCAMESLANILHVQNLHDAQRVADAELLMQASSDAPLNQIEDKAGSSMDGSRPVTAKRGSVCESFGMLIEVTTDNHIQGRADVAA